MKILVFDHFYEQDITELKRRAPVGSSLTVIPYQRLALFARLFFHRKAFYGVGSAYQGRNSRSWSLYNAVARKECLWMASAYRPSLVIFPTDSIFYFRPFITEFQALKIPVVVVQKETTISELTLETFSQEIKKYVPPIFDYSTLCSERQREFWQKCGASEDNMFVTGQPRFDYYSSKPTQVVDHTRKAKLLYLSFDDNAYLDDVEYPQPGLGAPESVSWHGFRREVEEVLSLYQHHFDITIKHHPQQRVADVLSGSTIEVAPRNADTRDLISKADLVVGFQTTAIFESAIAGRQVLYVAWGEVFDTYRDRLVAFQDLGQPVTWCSSAKAFSQSLEALAADSRTLDFSKINRSNMIDYYLGPQDGLNSVRVWSILLKVKTPPPNVSPGFLLWLQYFFFSHLLLGIFLILAKAPFGRNRKAKIKFFLVDIVFAVTRESRHNLRRALKSFRNRL